MIIEGKPAGSVDYWSNHLLRTDTNEQAEVMELRGVASDNLPGALREMEFVAGGSRSHGNFMYQANINPYTHEHLTPEQWKTAVDRLEKNLGLEDHQRAVVRHVKEGREHYHVIWNRVDSDTLKVRDITGNYYVHDRTARELEAEFDLQRTPRVLGERDGPPQTRRIEFWEYQRGKESGTDPREIKAEVSELWRGSDSGQAFVAALEDRGYVLAKGDRRDFCIVDSAGDDHSLARRLDGVTVAELKARLAGIDREGLPTVAEAKDLQDDRRHGRAPAQDGYDWEDKLAAAAIQAAMADDRETNDALAPMRKAARSDDATLRGAENDAFWTDHADRADAAGEARMEAWQERAADARGEDLSDLSRDVVDAPLEVVDTLTDGAAKLADFVCDFLTDKAPPAPGEPSQDQVDRMLADRRAAAALNSIRDSIIRGDQISAKDVRSLTQDNLETIRASGDDGMRAIIRRMEDDARVRNEDRGRERDR